MRPVVIVVHQLGSGGATKAVIDQARMFSRAGVSTTIVTLENDPGFSENVTKLRKGKALPDDVAVLNIHEEAIRRTSVPPDVTGRRQRVKGIISRAVSRTSQILTVKDENLVESGRDKSGAYRRNFRGDGEIVAFERLNADGSIKHTNYFDNRILVRRDEQGRGAVYRRVWYESTGSVNREQYLTPDGFCYAQRWVDPQNGRGVGVYVAERENGTVRRFDGLPSWHVSWLQSVLDRFDVAPFVVGQSASVIPKIMGLRDDSAVRMAMMHNSHLAAPFNIDSPLRPDYASTFERLEDLDAFVILSERQRDDMVARVGGQDVMVVVPNVIEVPERRSVRRDPDLVSIVSRLAPQKAIHEAIEAFALVLQKAPDARLEIYGQGSERKELEELVGARSLESNVVFKGRTQESLDVMARSVCTVSTSEWEALPLSIAESLAVGTPVVAYDCLYGPSALIRDGGTGFIVPRGGREALASRIVGLLGDPTQVEEMGRAGRADVLTMLDSDPVLEKWKNAFTRAEFRYMKRNERTDPGQTP